MDEVNALNVTLISKYSSKGGAARATERLHKGLLREEIQAELFVETQQGDAEAVTAFQPPEDLATRFRRTWRRRRTARTRSQYGSSHQNEWFAPATTVHAGDPLLQFPDADVVNLHWITDFIDLSAVLPAIDAPIVWTLHDMNAFTGGCHYTAGCRRFTQQCGVCPQLASTRERDWSREIWETKKQTFQQMDPDAFRIVTPSTWLAEEARQSSLLSDFTVDVIPNGLDTDQFFPLDPASVRRSLSLNPDDRVILFLAESTSNYRKGFGLLREALPNLATIDNLVLLSVGSSRPDVPETVRHIHLGRLSSTRLLNLAYNAADLFVIPSRQDNLPNTVLESLACGTPVVGFDAGGIPDMVRPGETGLLAEVENVRSLSEAITHILTHDAKRSAMIARCRDVAVSEYALHVQAERYMDLFNDLQQRSSTS